MKQRPTALDMKRSAGLRASVSQAVFPSVVSPSKITTTQKPSLAQQHGTIQPGQATNTKQNTRPNPMNRTQRTTATGAQGAKKAQSTAPGKKSGNDVAFSLLPLHEQVAAAAGKHESTSEEEDYDDYGSDRDPSNDSYWFTSSDEDDEEGE